MELLKQAQRRVEYHETIRKQLENRRGHRNIEERWNEMKNALIKSATQHLHRKRQYNKK